MGETVYRKPQYIKAMGGRAHIIASETIFLEHGRSGRQTACGRALYGFPMRTDPHPRNICKECLRAVEGEEDDDE